MQSDASVYFRRLLGLGLEVVFVISFSLSSACFNYNYALVLDRVVRASVVTICKLGLRVTHTGNHSRGSVLCKDKRIQITEMLE